MNHKDKLLTLARQARKRGDLETLEQVKELNESLNVLSDKEKGLLHWGVYSKWLALDMNSKFFYHLRDYKKYNLGVSFSSAGQVLVKEIVHPDKDKVPFGSDIIELQFVASDVISEELSRRSLWEDMSNEIGEIESDVEKAVSDFMSDIVQFAETYGWLKCSQSNSYAASRAINSRSVTIETGISLKEIIK